MLLRSTTIVSLRRSQSHDLTYRRIESKLDLGIVPISQAGASEDCDVRCRRIGQVVIAIVLSHERVCSDCIEDWVCIGV